MRLGGCRKQVYPEETHVHTGRTCTTQTVTGAQTTVLEFLDCDKNGYSSFNLNM